MGASATWRRIEMDIFNFDSYEVPIVFSGCGHKRTETIGVLRKNPIVKCSKCASMIMFNSRALDEGLRGPERTIAELLHMATE
jgi:hypothetical protein